MAFSMKVSKETLEGQDAVPANQYKVKLTGFAPKISKNGDSFNLNPRMEIIEPAEFAGKKVFTSLNSNGAFIWPDFAHCFGLEMHSTDGGQTFELPGTWEDSEKFPEDPSKWKYKGPLVGRTGMVELAVDSYNGKDQNKIRRYFCGIPNCQKKHIEDLMVNNNSN